MDKKIKITIAATLISIIIGVIAYSTLGALTYVNNTAIHDMFPERFFYNPNNQEEGVKIRVYNNAPWSFPSINPFYSLRANITAENDAYVYFIGLGQKKLNFTESSIDLGKIDAGDYDETTIYLHPDEGNLTLKIDVYLNFWIRLHAATETYSIEYLGDYEYEVKKIT